MEQRSRALVLHASIPIISVVVTLATGLLLISHFTFPPPEVWNYGLPLSWRAVLSYSSQRVVTLWSWFAFSVDTLFFIASGYVFVIPYEQKRRGRTPVTPTLLLSVTYVILVLFASISFFITYGG